MAVIFNIVYECDAKTKRKPIWRPVDALLGCGGMVEGTAFYINLKFTESWEGTRLKYLFSGCHLIPLLVFLRGTEKGYPHLTTTQFLYSFTG